MDKICSTLKQVSKLNALLEALKSFSYKVTVHVLGKICPTSDSDIAHMRYYLGLLKLKYI